MTPPPPYLSKRMGRLLGRVAARSVDAVLAEFAGPDELSARTNADAGAVERRVAAALAARPADIEERDVYVKASRRSYTTWPRAARFKMETRRPRRTRPSRGGARSII